MRVRLPWVATIAANYEIPLWEETTGVIGADYYWRSGTSFSALQQPGLSVGSYGLVGARVGIEGSSSDSLGNWNVSISGRNLTDVRFPSSLGCGGDLAPPGITGENNCFAQYSPDAFRTIWFTVETHF